MATRETGEYLAANQALWDEWAEIHARSQWYDLEAVRQGNCKLRPYELEEVGDVEGRRLLHLQCQIGTDTVCWAQRGASATGVDFSPRAVAIATDLARELGVDARFVCADVLLLPDLLGGTFDVVYTSRGVLRWLPNLSRWAEVVAHFLAPGGTFYITEIHPVAKALIAEGVTEPRAGHAYFPRPEPLALPVQGSYADPTAEVTQSLKYLWPHSMGELVTAVAAAGLHVEFLHEFPWADRPFSFLEQHDDRTWVFPAGSEGELPLFFSLKATKAPTS
jgi:SAM-dependent methyltransferase